MIIDASDLDCEILGKCSAVTLTDEQLCEIVRDNPAGQEGQCTPFILIRRRLRQHRTMKAAALCSQIALVPLRGIALTNKKGPDLRGAGLSHSLVSSARNASTVGSRSVSGYS